MTERTCLACEEPLTGRQTKYCSRQCNHRTEAGIRTADGRRAEQRRRHAEQRSQYMAGWHERKPDYSRLHWQDYYQRNHEAVKERQRLAFKPMSPRVIEARKKIRKAARGTTGRRNRWVQGACRRCGVTFLVLGNGPGLAAYCSGVCSIADSKDRRRARKRGAFVERVFRKRIFERDGWRCQLCRKLVKRDKKVPHPLAPTLDHITPLADGGRHEAANLQCAHFICNSTKGAGGTGQLRLIG